ncbi:hypothetical protein Peur_070992 [Populus x canadensis]
MLLAIKVDDKLYIYTWSMCLVPTSKNYFKNMAKFSEIAIRSYTQQILCELAYLHAKNIIHG